MRPASSSSPQLQPISVLFTLPQQQLGEVNRAFAKAPLPVEVFGPDNKTVIDKGVLKVVDNQVDQTTGTIKLKAEFPNGDMQLWPGQFVNVRLLINTLRQVVVAPTAAVQRGPNGTFVYVVQPDSAVAVRLVTVAQQDETQTVVARGLQSDERVVTTGFARLTAGTKVTVTKRKRRPRPRRSRPRPTANGRASAEAGGASAAPRPARARPDERVHALHPASDRILAAGRGDRAGWLARLLAVAGLLAAAGRFPDHPGHHAIARREPRHHRRAGDGAAGAPVRPDPGACRHDVVELVRHQPDHAAVRSQPRYRRRRPGRAGGDQCRGLDAAAQSSLSADLRQGEPGGCADHHAGAHLADHRAARDERPGRHADGAAVVRGDRRRPRLGAGRHPAGGAHSGRSGAACRLRHRAGGRAPGDRRRQCLRAEGRARRRAPVLHHRGQRSARRRRPPTVRWSWPTATARRCCWATWRRSSTAWKTPRSAPGTRARRPSSSTSSASPAPT